MYNPDGIRTARHFNGITTEYLVDSNRPYAQVVQESTGTAQRFYTYGLDLINQEQVNTNDTNNTASNAVSYYLYDALGSTRALTDENGNVTDEYSYSAYGDLLTQTGTTENHYLHTGEQYDAELDQYYLRARYRDGSVFTQMDEWQGCMSKPDTLNKYAYVSASPINMIDPSGRSGVMQLGVPGLMANLALSATARHATKVVVEAAFVGVVMSISAGDRGWSIAEATASPNIKSDEDAREYEKERKAYHNRCDEPEPPGINNWSVCERWKWRLRKHEDCADMREDFSRKWFNGKLDEGHKTAIESRRRAAAELRRKIEKRCK